MNVLLLVALALGAPFRSPYPPAEDHPAETYEGGFDRPPAEHYVVPLPGGRMNAAAHSEQSRPVLHDGTVLVGSAAGEALYMIDRSNGALLRTYPAAASVESEAVVVGERVYFADTGGHTWCYDLDGTEVWHHDSAAPILVRPTVANGIAYVTNVDDLVMAFEADTGKMLWQYRQKRDVTRRAELSLYAAPPAVVVGEEVLVGFSSGDMVALSATGGDVRWAKRVGVGRYPDVVAEPSISEDLVFVSGYFEPLLAVERDGHRIRWTLDQGSAASALLAGAGGEAVLYHPGTDGKLRAIDAQTGEKLWTWESKGQGALTTPVLTGAGLVVGSSSGTVHLVSTDDGTTVWTYQPMFVMEGVSTAPVVDGRQLLFVSNAGKLYSLLAPRTSEGWDKPLRKRKKKPGKPVVEDEALEAADEPSP